MRDNKEIERVILQVKHIWRTNPSLRLGQLLVNAAGEAERESDIFYIEDDDLLKYLRHYNEKHKETK